MTDELREQKESLALCLRMLEHEGIMDYNGHASVRLGGDRLLINAGGAPRSRLSAEDICTVDFDGTLLEGAARRHWNSTSMPESIARARMWPRSSTRTRNGPPT